MGLRPRALPARSYVGLGAGLLRCIVGAVAAGVIGTVAALGGPAAAWAQARSAPSAAEQALFSEAHFTALQPPAQLVYRYERRVPGKPDAGFTDTVTLHLTPTAVGRCCAVRGEFLSGARQLALPELDDAAANPVTMYFLEREVRELQRETRGQAAHFRRRIRLALAAAPPPRPVTVHHQGRELPAREIEIAPYVDDPLRARFERQAQRRYRFVLAAELPGVVWRLQTEQLGEHVDVLTLMETPR
jgi:hypothetical protein